jgi:hypothetical protein
LYERHGFYEFWLSFCEENEKKVSACFHENRSSISLQDACSGFPVATLFHKPPVILKIVPKASHDVYTG